MIKRVRHLKHHLRRIGHTLRGHREHAHKTGIMGGTGKKTWILMAVAVAIIIGVIWYAVARNRSSAPTQPAPPVVDTSKPEGPTPQFAADGQVTPGFPSDLLLDKAGSIQSSYSIGYPGGITQYTVSWNSSTTPAALLTEYETYLGANGWSVPASKTQSGKYGAGLYATKGSDIVNFSAAAVPGGSQATIAYVTQQ